MSEILTTSVEVTLSGPEAPSAAELAGLPFGEIAVALRLCSQAAVDEALSLQMGEDPPRVGEILVSQGYIDAEKVAQGNPFIAGIRVYEIREHQA